MLQWLKTIKREQFLWSNPKVAVGGSGESCGRAVVRQKPGGAGGGLRTEWVVEGRGKGEGSTLEEGGGDGDEPGAELETSEVFGFSKMKET